jgi:tetratricopeptide (TPR) repeat protein
MFPPFSTHRLRAAHRGAPTTALLGAGLLSVIWLIAPFGTLATAKDVKDDTSHLLGQVQKIAGAGQADSALSLLRSRIILGPGDGRLERALASIALDGGMPWAGVLVLEESLRLRPDDVNLHVALGEIELGRGRPDVAVRHFQRALVINSASPAALAGFGRARARQDTGIESAISYLSKLAKQRPGTPEPRYGKGVLLLEAGRVEESLTEFRWAIGLDENNWYYERDYGQALLRLGNEKSAIEHLERAKRLVAQGGDPLTADRIAAEIRALAGGGKKS